MSGMKYILAGKQIILGVTGGIAAYKSADLIRRLRDAGAIVRVVMTQHAKEFITPLTLQAVSGNPIHENLFDLKAEAAMGHIELARWADVILVAPATADFMARLLKGEADDLLTTLCLAAKAPITLAPAMNQAMWKNTLTQENVQALKAQGVHIIGPAHGNQACGDVGPGRMVEPEEIVTQLSNYFSNDSLAGKYFLITAGPTREPLDPVRYISNASSGKMGYALAMAAREAGARVTLISGPVHLPKPDRIHCIDVVNTQEMLTAVMAEISHCDVFLSVAAPADYRPKTVSTKKLAKSSHPLLLELEPTPDIVKSVAALSPRPFVIGFAAETDHLIEKARAKLSNKKLDMVIANEVGKNQGMESDENAVTVLGENFQQAFPRMPKKKLARELIQFISKKIALFNKE